MALPHGIIGQLEEHAQILGILGQDGLQIAVGFSELLRRRQIFRPHIMGINVFGIGGHSLVKCHLRTGHVFLGEKDAAAKQLRRDALLGTGAQPVGDGQCLGIALGLHQRPDQ